MESYRGILVLLMQKHLEFQLVTPRTLRNVKGKTLILPDVRVLGPEETCCLLGFENEGGRLVITGTNATQMGERLNIRRFPDCPGKAYMAALQKDVRHTRPALQIDFLKAVDQNPSLEIAASAMMLTSVAQVGGSQLRCFRWGARSRIG